MLRGMSPSGDPVRVPRRPSPWAEVALIAALYVGYSLTRVLVNADPATAMANGELVLAAERALGLDVEAAAVRWLVDSTALSVVAGYLYALLHYTVTPAVLVWVYRRHPEQYRSARLILLAATSSPSARSAARTSSPLAMAVAGSAFTSTRVSE